MIYLTKITFNFLVLLMISACSTGPHPIDYGKEGCHYCRMTIVDKIHGTELITDKGKVFKFDATECMLNYMAENKQLPIGNLLTNYFEAPTEFINIQNSTFLISEKLPSPMGANITAFETESSAEEVRSEKGGEIYTWEELRTHLDR
ncbi:nitrous oxide reductase accessory protein NosL [Algoriphagus persicinus]|uniref:nitrous oxide reductase accessory protein NosL n=1 Tax=Algoriphagus persicinus TaxID=3108754 RepID=UPI002B3A0201|nr:nitrous oxide reductase accessory protein NosL [Algoriphagus sp. E1-3-M2]MEB2786231.1 nitrous oxide reductase accessory protein NosL [Algoriphagus sp. E1-3-M2]